MKNPETDALRLVPVEPNHQMHYDGDRALANAVRNGGSIFDTTKAIWSAMLAAAPASPLPEGGGQCSGITGELKSPDLDALEKLADRCSFGDPWYTEENLLGRQNFGQFLPQDRAFIAAANPATIKAMIAEVRSLRVRVARWEPPMTTSTASSSCSAFLARNGKGERQ